MKTDIFSPARLMVCCTASGRKHFNRFIDKKDLHFLPKRGILFVSGYCIQNNVF